MVSIVSSLIHRKSREQVSLGDSPSILAIQVAGIGDLLLSTPALDALKERYPKSRIDLVSSPRAVELLKGHKSLDNLYSFDVLRFRNPVSLLRPSNFREANRQIRSLRNNHYDILLSLNNVASVRGAITLGLVLKRIRGAVWAGRNTDGRAPYFDISVKERLATAGPEPLIKLELVKQLGASAAPRRLSFPDVSKEGRELQEQSGRGKWAAVIPGKQDLRRAWPLSRFIEVASNLKDMGYNIAVVGGPGERSLGTSIQESLGESVKNFCGVLSLRQTAILLSQMKLVVTNDTGPMHIAAAVNTPMVAIFDPIHVRRFRPWMPEGYYRVVVPEWDGRIRGNVVETIYNLLQTIPVQTVMGEIDCVLNNAADREKDTQKDKTSIDEFYIPDNILG